MLPFAIRIGKPVLLNMSVVLYESHSDCETVRSSNILTCPELLCIKLFLLSKRVVSLVFAPTEILSPFALIATATPN